MLAPVGVAVATAAPKAKTKPATATAPAEEKKDEAPGHIDGMEIARPGGGFLGLQVVNSNFVLSFYDAKKKKAPVDVARATLRWPVKYQPNDERTVLNAGADGTSLSSAKTIRPPHNFKVFVNLFVDDKELPVESYVVEYRQ
jgi:hypothetical protein